MNRRDLLKGSAGGAFGLLGLVMTVGAEEKVADSLAGGDSALKKFLLEECGMEYFHLGIPTKEDMKWDAYLENLKVHIQEYENDPFGIEWMKFEEGSPMPKVIQERPHVAFLVKNLDKAIKGMKLLVPVSIPRPGIKTCFIEHKGIGIEFVERVK